MQESELLFKLIQRQGTIDQVSHFLKEKNLPSSAGSWRDMIDNRLRKLFENNQLGSHDLINLLRQTEEYGSQHIFFYQLIDSHEVSHFFKKDFAQTLISNKLPALGTTSIVDLPEKPTVVEVRYTNEKTQSIIFKLVEKRTILNKVSDTATNGQLVITYDQIPYRAVNLLKISADGTAEIRLQSHSDSTSYKGLAESVFTLLDPVVNRLSWKDHKLDNLKANLFDNDKRAYLQKIFGLRHTQHSNTDGTRLSAAVGMPGASMYDDGEAVASVDRFLQKKDHAHCEKVSVMLMKNEGLNRSIGLLISGEPNEMAITSKVSELEYQYIVRTVLENNV
ncbi:hypothetical protein KQ944_12500 [Bacillus subtilis]|uniref:hypothetical protein n=1 Tax=Pseudochrobactrum asaccharolyticum TaxID=354351 RepID=UPI001F353C6E|nr:hypothetical protein [Pseudochrobactrum asaccharolyticum]MCF7645986.1 hypothetical protein [Pseudochrobactrum asaccharolyticum]MCF7672453.1 hypothetical protein [Bacillus subtilis]